VTACIRSLTAFLCLLWSTACWAAQPVMIELNQGGQKVVYYRLGEKQYREERVESLAGSKENTKICVQAKLAGMQGNVLQVHGVNLQDLRCELMPGVTVAAMPGSNLWLGGVLQKDAGGAVFRVEAVAELASDLKLFQERWAALAGRQDATPEEYYRLGWWIADAEKVASGLSAADFDQYRKDAGQAFREALQRDIAGLKEVADKALAAIAQRYRKLVDESAGATLQGNADWHVNAYRQLLHAHGDAIKALTDGQPVDAAARKRLLAGLYLLLGRLQVRYLDDRDAATMLFLETAKLSPEDPEVGKELRSRGYVLVGREWLTEAEAKARQHERETAAQAEATRKAQEAAALARAQARAVLMAGEGAEKKTTVVDALLSKPTDVDVGELCARLPELPEDVVRYALWCGASLPQNAQAVSLATTALSLEAEAVRPDAIDLLVIRSGLESAAVLIRQLAKEKSAAVSRHAILALQRIPGNDAVDALILVLETAAVPLEMRKLAAQILTLETGQTFGPDAFSWKLWWKKSRATFERPEL